MTRFRPVGLVLFLVSAALAALSSTLSPPAYAAPAFAPPIVVVYPLTFSGAIAGNEAGADVAIVISQKLAESGGLSVKPYIPGTTRAQYLDAAISQRADYYITGFLQTIGEDVTMILQVVSTHSGSVVYSTTATIRTFGDAGLQADALHAAILRHAGRGLAALDAPPPAADASPSMQPTNGPGVNLTRALRKRSRATPAPSPSAASDAGLTPVAVIEAPSASPSASPVPTIKSAAVARAAPASRGRRAKLVTPAPAPSPTASPAPSPSSTPEAPAQHAAVPASPVEASSVVLVVDAAGSESPDMLAYASNALAAALRAAKVRAARLPITAGDARKNAARICEANSGTARYYAPSLILGRDDSGALVARLSVESIDCAGSSVATRTSSGIGTARGGDAPAIDRAAAKMVPLLAGT